MLRLGLTNQQTVMRGHRVVTLPSQSPLLLAPYHQPNQADEALFCDWTASWQRAGVQSQQVYLQVSRSNTTSTGFTGYKIHMCSDKRMEVKLPALFGSYDRPTGADKTTEGHIGSYGSLHKFKRISLLACIFLVSGFD